MGQTIQLLTKQVTISPEDDYCTLVDIYNIEFEDIAPQFTAQEMLEAIVDHYNISTVFDIVMKLKGEDDE